MRLEIGNFYVKDIKFGDKLSFDDGVLTINKEKALDFIREDERITEADLYIAKPGDKIRMCPVLHCISSISHFLSFFLLYPTSILFVGSVRILSF